MTKSKIIKPICIPCPDPKVVILCPTKPYYDASEFSSSMLTNAHGNFNSTKKDRKFLHTLIWKPDRKCCQVLKAKLVVKMKSISKGNSPTSSDAGNDGIYIVKNGGTQIDSSPVYSSHPFSAGTKVTKTFILSGSQLNWLNSNNTLSIYVQDDTAVLSIELELHVCCLSKRRKLERK